jgi:segregation and condensation protein A
VADFRVDLNLFRGPMDLLLYLVRKHEVEVVDIPIAVITEQYLQHLEVLKELDCNAVGDFVAMASTLVEIKSQQILPRSDDEEDSVDDSREDLVRRLLEYKKYRDAASILEERSRHWQQRYPRIDTDLPTRERNLAEEPIQEVELWDLVSAFGRVIRDATMVRSSNIVYDDTPIRVYMSRIYARLVERGRLAFSDLFAPGMHKSALVGVFLAALELIRHSQVRVEQNNLFGEIWLLPPPDAAESLDLSHVDEYAHGAREAAGAEPATAEEGEEG